jgi:HEPN domain-containing protein
MNRKDFQNLARIRIQEAKLLLKNRHYEGAYYLCGYGVECGLKACIAKKTKRHEFPDKNTVNASYTHDLSKLTKIAGINLSLVKAVKKDKIFESNWAIVKDWTEKSRYEKPSDKKAKDLYSATTNKKNGVMQWIEKYW